MKTYNMTNRLCITLLSALFLLLSCKNQDSENFDRKIELEGEHNFRDLGQYATTDDQVIRKGMIYRSGSLYKLTDTDQEKLKELGIKTVVNFLIPEEIQKQGGDKLPQGIKSIYLPINGHGNEVNDLIIARETGDFSNIPTDFNFKVHKILPEAGKDAYSDLFEVLKDSTNYPLVFHCSHGVHRTGTAAAILLGSLGVPWQTIENDYMLSNSYRLSESQRRISYLDSIAQRNQNIVDKELNKQYITSFYMLQPGYLDGTKDFISSEYGSIQAYLESGGITEEDLESIRDLLLE